MVLEVIEITSGLRMPQPAKFPAIIARKPNDRNMPLQIEKQKIILRLFQLQRFATMPVPNMILVFTI